MRPDRTTSFPGSCRASHPLSSLENMGQEVVFTRKMRGHSKRRFTWFKPDREKDRYYLLPGMGGRALRRKQKVILRWTFAAGALTAAVVGTLIYIINKS